MFLVLVLLCVILFLFFPLQEGFEKKGFDTKESDQLAMDVSMNYKKLYDIIDNYDKMFAGLKV